jgi:hypothetical protein
MAAAAALAAADDSPADEGDKEAENNCNGEGLVAEK